LRRQKATLTSPEIVDREVVARPPRDRGILRVKGGEEEKEEAKTE
jgi:hypothetical protein